MQEKEESYAIGKETCPRCKSVGRDNSGDNLVSYSDGHKYCFACKFYSKETSTVSTPKVHSTTSSTFISGSSKALAHRCIQEETCKLYNYKTGTSSTGESLEIEDFISAGVVVSQHIRQIDSKNFFWLGDTKNLPFYGQWLFPKGGKRLLITEGAIDCLTMSQLFGNKYPVVSIPNGVTSAVKACRDNYDFVASFETIVLCFDMDEPGQAAARAVADILPPGKVKIMKLSRKDPNEMLVAAESAQLLAAYWNASSYSPDSILHVSSIINTPKRVNTVYEYPWESLTTFTVGQDSGRLNLWAAAPGQGKSSLIRELVIKHLKENRGVGCIFLEESPEQTVDDLISLCIKKPVRRIQGQRQLNTLRTSFGKDPIAFDVVDSLSDKEYNQAADYISKLPLFVYDHIGNADVQNVLNRLDYMAIGLGCQVLVIDHITLLGNMLLSSKTDTGANSERLVLDDVMKHLRSLVERTGCIIHVISHIKKNDKNTDGGDSLSLNDLRGSGSLAQIADNVFSLERNRQHTDPLVSNTTIVRVLKNRKSGKCGIASALFYNSNTSCLEDVNFTINQEGKISYFYEQAKTNV